jgi:Concanavalin A-like lectin/glucanases superfamily
MSVPYDPGELRALLDALVEESIAPEQVRRLEELVLKHPEAEAFYVQYLGMVADLSRHFAGDKAATSGVTLRGLTPPARRELSPARRRRAAAIAAAVVGVAAALLVAVNPFWKHGLVAPPSASAEPTDDSIAILAQTSGAEWEETGLPTHSGAPLPAGRLVLKAGVAQIEFYSGATVILEGPADFRLDSASQAYCTRGKLRVTVPPQAQGFTVGSPAMDLIDRGTEFGMRIDPAMPSEVHVFQGKVEVHEPGSRTAGMQELTTGNGVRVARPGVFEAIPADSAAFLSAQDVALRSEAETKRRQRDWLAASSARRADPGLVVYYAFTPDTPWERTLRDRAAGQPKPHDGAIVGCPFVTSRWAGKQGLEFKRVSDRVRFNVAGDFASLSLAAWVRVDALPNQFNSLMMADGWEDGGVHWHINDRGEIALGIQGPDKKNGTDYRTPRMFTADRLGQWTHLVVVFDRAARQVTHYVNGKIVQQDGVRFDVPLRLGDAEIGNWNVGSRRDRQPIRNLRGCVDEFLLWSRPLAAAEVEELFRQGRTIN